MALPASGYLSDASRTEGEMKTALEDQRDVIALLETGFAAGWVNPLMARFEYVSATQCRLAAGSLPQRIGGVWTLKYAPTVTLANGGLAASQYYFVYAFDNAGTRTLEASITAHTADATTGIQIKTGDATRTLVGFLRTNASSQFEFGTGNLSVLSYYNRRQVAHQTFIITDITFGGATPALIASGPNFLHWGDAAVTFHWNMRAVYTTAGGAWVTTQLDVDGAVMPGTSMLNMCPAVTTPFVPVGGSFVHGTLAEGFHSFGVRGGVSAGVGHWVGAASPDCGHAQVVVWG